MLSALRRHAQACVLLAGIFVACGMVGVFAAMLWGERDDALLHAQQQAANLALVAERDIARNLELYALSLQAMVDGYRTPAAMALPDGIRRNLLFDRSITARNITSAAILDQDGRLVLNLRSDAVLGQNLSDRDYFQSHLRQGDDALHVSAPFVSRLVPGVTNIALSRRMSGEDGGFLGVAVLFINVNYFHELLQGLDIGPHGRTTVFGPQGRVIMTEPYTDKLVGVDRSNSAIYQATVRASQGSFVSGSSFDSEERSFVFRTVPGTSIKVLVALATADVYRPWLNRVLLIGAAVLAFAVLLVMLAHLLGRELAARMRAEDRLVALANTDGLTGLANRRALEGILQREAGRVSRGPSGLAVLFVDVDYFKRYNDTQGHPAGDRVLAAIARALEAALQRPGDHAGRYGGEEFMAVLGQTNALGACAVAERVRNAVQALAVGHPASPLGRVTVSVGVAAMSQGEFADIQALVKAADAALYRAKAQGRNQVCLHTPGSLTPPAVEQ